MLLHIGNRNYSSWSFRPWIAMRVKGIAFDVQLTPFDDEAGNPRFREFSPSGRVPALVAGALTVWESLAILEYLADRFPDAGWWPAEIGRRAHARSIANEMHGGFAALRHSCPMNMRRSPRSIAVSQAVDADVARIERIWEECLKRSGGPFLYGEFTIADAMYAPVVSRFDSYCLSQHPASASYGAAMKSLPAWQEWETQARAEPWILPAEEV